VTNQTFDAVRRFGLKFPDVVEGTAYGSPALKVGDAMFACIAIHRSAEPGTLAVRVGFDARDELIAAEPDVYYLTEHYIDYPVVLARLGRIHRDALKDLVAMGRRFVTSARPARRKRRPRSQRI
jgi:hypothetical protein